MRSADEHAPGTRQRISPGAQVTLSAAPLEALASSQAVAGRLFLLQGTHAEALPVPVQVSAQGALRVSAPHAALFGERRGAWDVLLFVGERAQLPESPEQAVARAEHDDTQLRVLRFPVELAP